MAAMVVRAKVCQHFFFQIIVVHAYLLLSHCFLLNLRHIYVKILKVKKINKMAAILNFTV